MINKKIPICPLLSIGSETPSVCLQENCAWYSQNLKTCGAYLVCHNAMLEIKAKQQQRNKE